jgi:hypothetical protein
MPMLRSRRLFLTVPLLLALAAGAGCASNETRQLARRLDPLIGKADKDFFIERYGEPVARTRLDSRTDLWEFVVSETPVSDRPSGGNLTTSTRLRVTFKDGILAAWQAFNTVR